MKKSTRKTIKKGTIIGLIAAAAIAAHYLAGEKNAKNRERVKDWAKKVKQDVVSELKRAHEVNKEAYHRILAVVAKRYGKLKTIDKQELARLMDDLKRHWNRIKKAAK